MRVVGHVYTMEKITLFAHLWHVSLLCNKQIIDYEINWFEYYDQFKVWYYYLYSIQCQVLSIIHQFIDSRQ